MNHDSVLHADPQQELFPARRSLVNPLTNQVRTQVPADCANSDNGKHFTCVDVGLSLCHSRLGIRTSVLARFS